uniref:Uncharacterized protein n=1 Tax=Timema douglasi TaxID=61478 RepID=A0A7R8VS93_TIMDO|nr:unnamed protein product [Timema douglasi]
MAQELLKFRQRAEAALATHCPDPQSHNGDRRRKRVWLSSPLMEKVQETVRPQACFMVMSRVDESENIRGVGPFVLERVISGAAESGVSIRKLCDGTIMIQTDNDIQMTKIMAMTEPLKPSKGVLLGGFPLGLPRGPLPPSSPRGTPPPPPGNSPSPGTKYVRLLLVRPLWSPVINVCGKTSEAAKETHFRPADNPMLRGYNVNLTDKPFFDRASRGVVKSFYVSVNKTTHFLWKETHLDDITPFLLGSFEKEMSLDIPLQMRTSPHY